MAIIYVPPNRPPYELYMQLGQMIMDNVKGNEQKAAMRVLQRNLSKLAPGQASPTPQQTQQGLDADLARDKEAMRTAALPNVDFAGTVANPGVVQNAAAQKLLEGYRQAATGAQQNPTLTSLIAPGQAAPVRQSSYPGLPGPSSKGDAMQYQIPSSLLPGGTFGGVPQYQKVSLTDMLGAIADPRVAALGPQAINSFMNTLLAATKQERDQGVADHAYGSAYTAKQAQAKQLMDYANSIPDPQMRAQLMTAAIGAFMGSPNESVAAAANTKMMEQRAAEEQYIRELIGRMNDQTNRYQISAMDRHNLAAEAAQNRQISAMDRHNLAAEAAQDRYNTILEKQRTVEDPQLAALVKAKENAERNFAYGPGKNVVDANQYAKQMEAYTKAILGRQFPQELMDKVYLPVQQPTVQEFAAELFARLGTDSFKVKRALEEQVKMKTLPISEANKILAAYNEYAKKNQTAGPMPSLWP